MKMCFWKLNLKLLQTLYSEHFSAFQNSINCSLHHVCFSHACFYIRLFTHRQTSVVQSEQTFFPAVFCMFSSHGVWLQNSPSLGRAGLKPLCLPPLGMSNGSSQGYHTLRFVIQYVFSAKSTVQRLRNAGQSAEVLKYQVGFSTALFWCSSPPPPAQGMRE